MKPLNVTPVLSKYSSRPAIEPNLRASYVDPNWRKENYKTTLNLP